MHVRRLRGRSGVRLRVGGVVRLGTVGAPRSQGKTIVHGDHFWKNLLLTSDGLRVIDWEAFGRGDPMWDLGFLIGVDRDLPEDEVESTLSEYARRARTTEWS